MVTHGRDETDDTWLVLVASSYVNSDGSLRRKYGRMVLKRQVRVEWAGLNACV
jgi:hypothetical protein